MERDFHYYAIAVLARGAGLSEDQALTLAYASQLVDDATNGDPMRLGEDDIVFEPVLSAHVGLRAYDWSVQKRVYMPFHFIPPKPGMKPGDAWVVQADSVFARDLVARAVRSGAEGGNGPFSAKTLCTIGIALHTYADTWAHEGFSGRHHPENNVVGLEVKRNGKWERLALEELSLNFWLPEIGHAEAGTYPDLPHIWWRRHQKTGSWLERNNPEAFRRAAKAIFEILFAWADKTDSAESGHPARMSWEDAAPRIDRLLRKDGSKEDRCAAWKGEFSDLFNGDWSYRENHWEREARELLHPSTEEGINAFYNSLWVTWHRAALRQRHYVLEQLL